MAIIAQKLSLFKFTTVFVLSLSDPFKGVSARDNNLKNNNIFMQ